MKQSTVALALGAAFVLVACGGGNDGGPPATDGVPADATASSGAFVSYVKALVAVESDTLEPFDISKLEAPTSETDDPAAVN